MKNTSYLLNIVAGSLCFAGLSFGAPNYVAHEWGTFTSVQGADGVQLAWNPLSVSDLPAFVHDWPRSGPPTQQEVRRQLASKVTSMTLQRMETPVIYFYADTEMTVNARVNFPQGTMTEWYPKATLPALLKDAAPFGPKSLQWENVRVMPAGATQITGDPIAGLPTTQTRSHYYSARETDADLLNANGETEKFLFYRGVGNFRAPLTVTQTGAKGEFIVLENNGKEDLRHLFIYEVGTSGGRFTHVSQLTPGARNTVKLAEAEAFAPVSTTREKLAEAIAKALTSEGLYAAEARAMVKTWDDSWFGENGLRVLYVLNGQWTDRVLPLTLEPKPAETVRVMVGRAELITPGMESDLDREIVRYSQGTDDGKAQAVATVRALGLGRFLEPTMRRLQGRKPNDKAFIAHSSELLDAAMKPAAEGKRLAAK